MPTLCPSLAGMTVQAKIAPIHGDALATRGGASPPTSAATDAASRCSSSNIILTCWSASPARLSARSPWPRGVTGTVAGEL